jgi:phosphoribosyl 1,2-cyclic phosphodiesterase
MKATFWGVRGSIPSPGPQTVHYGGNTTCVEVITDGGHSIILDAGTGIRTLGLELMKNAPVSCTVLISHTHWDHIQGLPFFVPLFVPGNKVDIYGGFDPVLQKDLRSVLAGQMEYSYFPVRQMELAADINYNTIQEGARIEVADAVVRNVLMNHPVLTFGYRIDCGGRSVFFSGDHEEPVNIYDPDDTFHGEFDTLIDDKLDRIADLARDVDLFIVDAQYTEPEIDQKRGWGHGTYRSALELARRAKAKRVCFTHHDPTRSDDALDAIAARLRERSRYDDPELLVAREGLTLEV